MDCYSVNSVSIEGETSTSTWAGRNAWLEKYSLWRLPTQKASAQFVQEKSFWIYSRLAEKERLQRAIPIKEYVDGEGFLYLGRSYRLKLVDEQDVPLKLSGGRFRLLRSELERAREHFIRWYREHARDWLSVRVEGYQARMEVAPGGVRVQDLGLRWGSCGKGAILHFHWKTILLPKHIAEYVAVHEMVHLHEPHHTTEFRLRLERATPYFAQRKDWLAEHGIEVEGL
ncbi:SprT family zinc-dependent metalloprotease [Pseudomonas sp. BN102]|uniref:M48 family metallopeptidase n=1 Tax=Pseudomonas sp. BN102 TaxID=2567886 RepID=UPI002454837F|nr:SprT family zinc-dependent metalloprotease [Pseudomonas sp. BN102]MDH4607475.1 M48 family metallopeptidase [Pseudomonas sp. BN102]